MPHPMMPAADVHASYARLLNHLPGLVYRCKIVKDYNYILEVASQGSYDLLGLTPEEMVRESWNTNERMM